MNVRNLLLTFAYGAAGGALFFWLRLPLPWILGPALATIIVNGVRPGVINWPRGFSQLGLITIAFLLGRTITPETARSMMFDLPGMLAAALLWIVVCFVIGTWFARTARMEASTCVLGCMPGGLSQMVLMAEDMRGADPGTVALIQTIRLVVVLYAVPFLAAAVAEPTIGGMAAVVPAAETAQATSLLGYLLLPFVLASAWLMQRFRVPAGEFTGPALFTGTIAAFGLPWPPVPDVLTAAAQFAIGIYIGDRVQPRLIWTNKRLAPLAFVTAALLVALAALSAWVLSWTGNGTIVTWFLALAPGGLAEMAATSIELDADVSRVTSFQMARLFTILLLAPPILRWLIGMHSRYRRKQTHTGSKHTA